MAKWQVLLVHTVLCFYKFRVGWNFTVQQGLWVHADSKHPSSDWVTHGSPGFVGKMNSLYKWTYINGWFGCDMSRSSMKFRKSWLETNSGVDGQDAVTVNNSLIEVLRIVEGNVHTPQQLKDVHWWSPLMKSSVDIHCSFFQGVHPKRFQLHARSQHSFTATVVPTKITTTKLKNWKCSKPSQDGPPLVITGVITTPIHGLINW